MMDKTKLSQKNSRPWKHSDKKQVTITSMFVKQHNVKDMLKKSCKKECLVIDLSSDDDEPSNSAVEIHGNKVSNWSPCNLETVSNLENVKKCKAGCHVGLAKTEVCIQSKSDKGFAEQELECTAVHHNRDLSENLSLSSASSDVIIKETFGVLECNGDTLFNKYRDKSETSGNGKRKFINESLSTRSSARLRLKRHKRSESDECVGDGVEGGQELSSCDPNARGNMNRLELRADMFDCVNVSNVQASCCALSEVVHSVRGNIQQQPSQDVSVKDEASTHSTETCFKSVSKTIGSSFTTSNFVEEKWEECGDEEHLETAHESWKSLSEDQGFCGVVSAGIPPNDDEMNNVNASNVRAEFSQNTDTARCTSVDFESQLATSDENSQVSTVTETSIVSESQSTVDDTEREFVPYYYENFLLIVKSVLELKDNEELFDDEDKAVVNEFYTLSEEAQKLYIRLFQRKHRWILQSRINYPKISSNLDPFFHELVEKRLLLSRDSLTDLEEILHLLPALDLRTLAKSLRINQAVKSDLIDAILKHSQRKSISSFFSNSSTKDSSAHVRKCAKSLLTDCYKVEGEKRGVFLRILMLFSLTSTNLDDDSMYGVQHQLFRMLMTNIGQMVYPQYTCTRQTAVFSSRQDVLWLELSLNYELDIRLSMERHRYETARDIYLKAKELYCEIQSNKKTIRWDKRLPEFLRCFTASSILTRAMTLGVEVLQKLRNYTAAVDQLRLLLKQKVYLPDYRGRWCDRMALNLDQHLKQPNKALDIIKSALNDPHIRGSHRWSLYQRARRICLSPSNKKLKERLDDFQHEEIQFVNKITIEGRLFPREVPGRKTVFITQTSDTSLGEEEITLCRVEQLVMEHYKSNLGYADGIHGEGSVYLTMFGLFFWEVIFMENIADVFYSPYQMEPLDINTLNFYKSRKGSIDELLNKIRISDVQVLQEMVGETWTNHYGTLCSLVSWEIFSSLSQVQDLISCLKGEFLAAIFEKFCTDLRHWHSGLPDLIMWNASEGTYKISEVKGPGDRLSTKQELWLDFFYKLGCDVEVCHVVGVGARKLKPSR